MKKHSPTSAVIIFLLFVLLMPAITGSAQTTRYVKPGGTGNGSSWSVAGNLQAMINSSTSGDSVFVLNGTYQPVSGQSLKMKEGVKIYGSFSGTESNLSQRIFGSNKSDSSILSGNGSSVIDNSSNNLSAAAVLNGFIITGGNIYSNYGGGINNTYSSPTITNCSFYTNKADFGGGGISNYYSSPTISNCSFYNNATSSGYGGAIYNENSSPSITNCSFFNNSAKISGGAIYIISSSSPHINNCSFYGNNAGSITGFDKSFPIIKNCIIDAIDVEDDNGNNTATITYSLVQGSAADPTNHNLDGSTDPKFVNAPAGNLQLSPCSPVINIGDTSGISQYVGLTDLSGQDRYVDAIDMGAYEYSGQTQIPVKVSTNDSATIIQAANSIAFYTVNCDSLIAKVASNDISPVSGSTTAYVWIEDKPIHYMSQFYAPRHYQITPANNAGIATATITLYFTQADFDAYNATGAMPLPTGKNDAIGINNLRIVEFTTNPQSGLPGSYFYSNITISPGADNIVWNSVANRWEVSFSVSGFGGFFVTTPSILLPVRWMTNTAELNNNNQPVINWKVQEFNVAAYQIEKSTNGYSYDTTGTVASISNGENSYSFTDNTIINGTMFYRIKQIGKDGSFSYSSIMQLHSNGMSVTASIYPNPATNKAAINITIDKAQAIEYRIIDNAGRILQQGSTALNAGNNIVPLNVANLAGGIYYVTLKGYTVNTQLTLIKQ